MTLYLAEMENHPHGHTHEQLSATGKINRNKIFILQCKRMS